MPFARVVPCIRSPLGVDVFDYRLADDSTLRAGDVVRVPFRRQPTPAVIISLEEESALAAKTLLIPEQSPLLRLPLSALDLLEATASRSFISRAVVLMSWLRDIPRRARPFRFPTETPRTTQHGGTTSHWVLHRAPLVIDEARRATGRVLILTPWQHRADILGTALKAPVLHADRSDGECWTAIQSFLETPHTTLIATRIGAWLATAADTVIIEEPENDDYKQDEQTPRVDARWMVEETARQRTTLSVILVGTTPPLTTADRITPAAIPSIPLTYQRAPRIPRDARDIENIPDATLLEIEHAVAESRPILILHPIHGERSRYACADCGWIATCSSCTFTLSRYETTAHCNRCGRDEPAPFVCGGCGGYNLNRARAGRDHLAKQLLARFPGAPISVRDLASWHREPVSPHSLVIVTDISLIGGVAEDIRRRERLLVAWRRLAALLTTMQATAIIHGPEELLAELPLWLTGDGVVRVWREEARERALFGFPLAPSCIKYLIDTTVDRTTEISDTLIRTLPDWTIRGPFPVEFRASTRKPRVVFHLLSPTTLTEADRIHALAPLAKNGIIDLDPIAFFR